MYEGCLMIHIPFRRKGAHFCMKLKFARMTSVGMEALKRTA